MPRVTLSFDLDLVPYDADPDDENVPHMNAGELRAFLDTPDGEATLKVIFGGELPPDVFIINVRNRRDETTNLLYGRPINAPQTTEDQMREFTPPTEPHLAAFAPCYICGSQPHGPHDGQAHRDYEQGVVREPNGYASLSTGPIFKRPGEERGGRRA